MPRIPFAVFCKRAAFLFLSFALLQVCETSAFAVAPQITLIDNAGKTQSAVELKPDGSAQISATLSYGNERFIPVGTKVSLLRVTGSSVAVAAVSTAEANGQVTFPDIREGVYKLKVACDEFSVTEAQVANSAATEDDNSISPENLETISIQDTSGVSRAVKEVAPGAKNTVIIKTDSESGKGFSGIKAKLVTLENNVRTDVAGDATINKDGESTFKNIAVGNYQVEYDCQNQTEAVSIGGAGVLNMLCPVEIGG